MAIVAEPDVVMELNIWLTIGVIGRKTRTTRTDTTGKTEESVVAQVVVVTGVGAGGTLQLV